MIISRAPTFVKIDGQEWSIETDFRKWCLFESILLGNYVPDDEKSLTILELIYPSVPINMIEALKKAVWFWCCGIEHSSSGGNGGGTGRKIYDYELDSVYIYSAFISDYGIDVESEKYLHWWKFRALMLNLRPENLFCRIMDYRGADLSKKSKEDRQHYLNMRSYYSLPISADEKEKHDRIVEALKGNGKLSEALKGEQ